MCTFSTNVHIFSKNVHIFCRNWSIFEQGFWNRPGIRWGRVNIISENSFGRRAWLPLLEAGPAARSCPSDDFEIFGNVHIFEKCAHFWEMCTFFGNVHIFSDFVRCSENQSYKVHCLPLLEIEAWSYLQTKCSISGHGLLWLIKRVLCGFQKYE